MNNKKTLYVTDLDGTLFDWRGRVPSRGVRILNRLISPVTEARGTLFTVATARRTASALPRLAGLNLKIPIITQNGAVIVDPVTGERIKTHYLTEEGIAAVQNELRAYDHPALVYSWHGSGTGEQARYLSRHRKRLNFYLRERKSDSTITEVESFEELWQGHVFYVTLFNPVRPADNLRKEFIGNGLAVNYQSDTYDTSQYWFEIFHSDANKASGAEFVKEYTRANKLVCFGDNLNDLTMLAAADTAVAVANAPDTVKQAAHIVIASNNSVGVPLYIENAETVKLPPPAANGKPTFEQAAERYLQKQSLQRRDGSTHATNIGALSEKSVHGTLKEYFALLYGGVTEVQIGRYYADVLWENGKDSVAGKGVVEIQTRGFGTLADKIEFYLKEHHVTVVYPFEKILLKNKKKRVSYSYKKAFEEFLKLSAYLTHKNVTFVTAETVNEVRDNVKYIRGIAELHRFDTAADYAQFVPSGLPERFTAEEFYRAAAKCKKCAGRVLLQLLETVGVIEKDSRIEKTTKFLYKIS